MTDVFKHNALDSNNKSSVISLRHLEDKDTLLSEGRDNSLKPNQEQKAKLIAREIFYELTKKNLSNVKIYTSDKKRTKQTSELVIQQLLTSKKEIGVDVNYDSRINELNNGVMNFPDNYKDGDWFEPLPRAWDRFFEQILSNDLLYRFGDAKLVNGIPTFPELHNHFNEYGENYAEFCSRIFSFLADLNINSDLEGGKMPVIITHNAIISVALEIAIVYYDFFNKEQNVNSTTDNTPTLNRLIWSVFKKYNNKGIKFDMSFGETRIVNLSYLEDVDFLAYLKREAELLQLVNTYSS